MANTGNLESPMCLMWIIKKPFTGRSRRSYFFSFLGFEWYLEAKCNDFTNNQFYDSISLKQSSEAKSMGTHFYVTTFILTNPTQACNFSRLGCTRKITKSCTVLWNFTTNDIYCSFPDYHSLGEWRVFCLFHDVPSSIYQTKHVINNKFTQTDELRSLSFAEKSLDMCNTEKISFDFFYLLQLEMHPDAELLCGGRIFKVHKAILSARSDIFKTIFENVSVETEKNVYDITDLTARVLDLILKYVYYGKISDLSNETAVDLYKGAHKYAMNSLQKACSDWMIENLKKCNCINFLDLASIHDDMHFKTAVVSFICRNPTVFKTTNWSEFAKKTPILANEILQQFIMTLNLEDL